MEHTKKAFVGFEYSDVDVDSTQEALYADCYENFGWTLEGASASTSPTDTRLKFRRDRKLRSQPELNRLQRQFDGCAEELLHLDRSKGRKASAVAYGMGIGGAAFMAGSVFAITGGLIPLGIILAIPAFAGWGLPHLAYTALRKKKVAEVTPLMDHKEDELYEICQKASALLAQA